MCKWERTTRRISSRCWSAVVPSRLPWTHLDVDFNSTTRVNNVSFKFNSFSILYLIYFNYFVKKKVFIMIRSARATASRWITPCWWSGVVWRRMAKSTGSLRTRGAPNGAIRDISSWPRTRRTTAVRPINWK